MAAAAAVFAAVQAEWVAAAVAVGPAPSKGIS